MFKKLPGGGALLTNPIPGVWAAPKTDKPNSSTLWAEKGISGSLFYHFGYGNPEDLLNTLFFERTLDLLVGGSFRESSLAARG